MPLYDYKCPRCWHEEKDVRAAPTDEVPCPACHYEVMDRLFPLPSPHIWKGSSEGAEPKKGRK